MTAPSLLWCRVASAPLAIVIATRSRLAASDMTPPVNRYLLLQNVELGAEAAEELRKQAPFITRLTSSPQVEIHLRDHQLGLIFRADSEKKLQAKVNGTIAFRPG